MKWLEKLALTVFSVLILVFSLVLCLILFGWIEASNVYMVVQFLKSTPTTVIHSRVIWLL